MKINHLIYEDKLSDEEFKSMTKDESLLWITRPRKDRISEAKFYMIMRSSLLGIALIYYLFKYGDRLDHDFLIGILFCYEFGYYSLKKEREERVYWDAMSEWKKKVDEYKERTN
jgi:hypothetical protein